MISRRSPPISLRDIRTDTIRRPHKLAANRVPSERIPLRHDIPAQIGHFLGHRIDPKILERELTHAHSPMCPTRALRPITNY